MSSPPSRPSPRDPGPQRQTRIRLERKVSLKFKNLEGFVNELSENISMGGMFLRTSDPPAPGTLFDFELTLEEEGPLIQGIAEVVWVREQAEGPRHPAGMGVRFLELAPGSRALIYQVVDEHIVAGGEPFELGGPRPPAPGTHGRAAPDRGEPAVRAGSYAVLASPQRKKTEGGDRGRRVGRRLVLLAGVAVLVGIGALALFRGFPAGEPEPDAPHPSPESAADESDTHSSPPRDRLDAVVPDPAGAPEEFAAGRGAEAQRDARAEEESTRVAAGDDSGSEGEIDAGTARNDAGSPQAPSPDRSAEGEPPPEPRPVAAPPATALDDITWRRRGETLVVTLTADGVFLEDRWDRFRMEEGTPREVVRIRGIRERHRPSIAVDEPELLRVRTGLHRRSHGDELHVVLDLGSPRVRLVDAESDGRRLHLTLFEGG